MRREWKLLLAFLSGMVLGEIVANPLDFIFFTYMEQLTAEQVVFAWYFIPALAYLALFLIAYMLARTNIIKAESFTYVLMAVIVVGAYLSWRALTQRGAEPSTLIILLGLPTAFALGTIYGVKKQL